MLTTFGDGDTKKGKMRRVSCSYIFEWIANHHLGGLGHRSRNNGGTMTFIWLLWESARYIGQQFPLHPLFSATQVPPTSNLSHFQRLPQVYYRAFELGSGFDDRRAF